MVERLLRAQPVSIANHIEARRSLIQRSVTWSATEFGWARSKRSAFCSGKFCGGFIIFGQCCSCGDICRQRQNHRNGTTALYGVDCCVACNELLSHSVLLSQMTDWSHCGRVKCHTFPVCLSVRLLFCYNCHSSSFKQGRIIHEAGEAEASGGPDRLVQRKFTK